MKTIYTKNQLIKSLLLLLFTGVIFSGLNAQVSGDFRSKNSGDYHDINNWETYNGTTWQNAVAAPASTNNVTIQASHEMTLDNAPAAQYCKNLIIEGSGKLSTSVSGKYLYCYGDLQIDGTLGAASGTDHTYIYQLASCTISGSGTLRFATLQIAAAINVIIDTDVTLISTGLYTYQSGNVTINQNKQYTGGLYNLVIDPCTVSITIKGNVTTSAITGFGTNANQADLIIFSDASGTGSLIHTTAAVPATVQRYIIGHGNVADEGWHLMGSPVATFTIDGSSFDPGVNDDLYAWDEATNTWLNHKAGNPTEITPGTGYILSYQGTGTKSFEGNLNVSNVTVSGLAHNAAQGKGWHLLGNPFASALQWNKTDGSWSLSNIAGTAKVWNSGTKAYVDVDPDGIIPSAQGFFVQVNESTTGGLTIPAGARIHHSTAWYKNTTSRILLSVSPTDGSSKQESQIRIEPEATNGYDFYYDSRFLSGYAPDFYSLIEDQQLSTNAIPSFQEGTDIPFGFVKNQHDSYIIRLEENLPGETISLKDLKLNLVHNLSLQPEYFFTSDEGDDPNRFLLHFGVVGLGEQEQAPTLQAYMTDNRLFVSNSLEQARLAVYDLQGRLVAGQSLNSSGLQALPLELPAGIYIVRISNSNESKSIKISIQ